MHLNALQLKKIQQRSLLSRSRIIERKDPRGRAFAARFFNRALALQIEIGQELLAVGSYVVHAKQNLALLHVSVVARRPLYFRERRIWPVPLAAGFLRAMRSDAIDRYAYVVRLIVPAYR